MTAGRTGARLGLGLAALGRPAYINLGHGADLAGALTPEALEARCHAVLDAAHASGLGYVDAARSYGWAEAFLERWLETRGIDPGQITIASKWGYAYTAGGRVDAPEHERKDLSLEQLERQWAMTRARLWEYLDIYQIHSATLESGVLRDRAVLRRLAELRDERGLRIGLTLSGPGQAETLEEALGVQVADAPLFEVVQATVNLLERSACPALERARARGWTVVLKEGLANGRLAGRDTSGRSPAVQAALADAASELGVGRDAVALAALLALPFVDVVLSGATDVAQWTSNLRAASEVPPARARDLWEATQPETAADYWHHRRTLAWN